MVTKKLHEQISERLFATNCLEKKKRRKVRKIIDISYENNI